MKKPRSPHLIAQARIRARLNAYRGRAFELFIRRKLTEAGFKVTRVNERDGYTAGVDLLIHLGGPSSHSGLVPVQVKRTVEFHDLFVALRECCKNSPGQPLCVAIHGWCPRGTRRPKLTVAVSDQPDRYPITMQILTLEELIIRLRQHQATLSPAPTHRPNFS